MTIAAGPIGQGPIGSSGGANYSMLVTHGTFTLSMQGAGKLITDIYPSGQFFITTYPSGFKQDIVYNIQSGTFTATFNDATVSRGKGLEALSGSFASTGHAVDFGKGLNLQSTVGAFTLTGQTQNYQIHISILPVSQAFTITFNDATVTAQFPYPITPQTFVLTGQSADVTAQRTIQVTEPTTFTYTGHDVQFRGWFSPYVPPAVWVEQQVA